jgi:hypothetical protein
VRGHRTGVLAALVLALWAAPAASAASTPLLGGHRASSADPARTGTGTARAKRLSATGSGLAQRLQVHVARGSTLHRLRAGIYADRRGRPGRLLGAGVTSVTRRGWVSISLRPVRVVAGHHYWIAVLPARGVLRSGRRGACRSETTRGRSLHRLPRRWRRGRSRHRCAPAALALPVTGSDGAPLPPPGGAGDGPDRSLPPGAVLRSPAQAIVDAARTKPLIRYGRRYPGGGDVSEGWGGGAPVVLAIASYSGNRSADARLLEQIRDSLAGGNEPVADGGYATQHERWITGMLAIVRHTPRIWDQLSSQEHRRAHLLMTGALVGSAFTTSDGNPYVVSGDVQRTLDGDTNVHRDWNPNFREGMLGMLLVAAAYFGGPAEAQAVLDGWRHAPFLAEVRAAGLTNLAETYAWSAEHPGDSAPSPAQIEQAVRGWRYHGLGLADPVALAATLTEDTYQTRVSCGLNGGGGISTSDGPAGIIVSGCSGLPATGAVGQLKEFDTIDAGGPRSSALYAYDSYRTNMVNHLALLTGGLWRSGPSASFIVGRMAVGVPDLFYKLDQGYRGYAKGELQWVPDAPSPGVLRADNPNFAIPLARALWQDVVAPYHGR